MDGDHQFIKKFYPDTPFVPGLTLYNTTCFSDPNYANIVAYTQYIIAMLPEFRKNKGYIRIPNCGKGCVILPATGSLPCLPHAVYNI